ncbi:MAG: cation diffusion facilitator family transporter [Chitinispirillales bacterium]|jgi:cation diffusion facilitator family transporter|nr:cation diffusion facilitator family transporter [Chitinispirillales bacterium]
MDKAKAGYVEGIISIFINTALFFIKLWASAVSGSIALAADAWHTLSDSISSIIVVAAVKLSSKKADKEHPFGHGRWEHVASLFIAVFLGVIAYEFLKNSIMRFNSGNEAVFTSVAIIVTIISIVTKEALARYAFYIGRKTENLSISADGWHHRTDALSSVVVLTGILFAKKFWWIDSVLGIIVAMMIFYATFEIMKETITKFLGEEPGQDLIDAVKKEILCVYNYDLEVHHFHIHNYVLHKELTFHIRLDKNLNIETGHKIASDIEKIIGEKFNMAVTIHVEPLYKNS